MKGAYLSMMTSEERKVLGESEVELFRWAEPRSGCSWSYYLKKSSHYLKKMTSF